MSEQPMGQVIPFDYSFLLGRLISQDHRTISVSSSDEPEVELKPGNLPSIYSPRRKPELKGFVAKIDNCGEVLGEAERLGKGFVGGRYELSATAESGEHWAFAVSDRFEKRGARLVAGNDDGPLYIREWPHTELVHISDIAIQSSTIGLVDDYLHLIQILDFATGNTLVMRVDASREGPFSCDLDDSLVFVSFKLSGRIRAYSRRNLEEDPVRLPRLRAPGRISLDDQGHLIATMASVGQTVMIGTSPPLQVRELSAIPSPPAPAPLSRLRGMIETGYGTMLLCDPGERRIVEIEIVTKSVRRSWSSFDAYPRAAIVWQGQLVAACGAGNGLVSRPLHREAPWAKVRLRDQSGQVVQLQDPHHLCLDNGRLVVTDSELNEILIVESDWIVSWRSSSISGMELRDPHQTTVTPEGLLTVDSMNDRIVLLMPDSSSFRVVHQLPAGRYPRWITKIRDQWLVSSRIGLCLVDGNFEMPLALIQNGIEVQFFEPPRALVYISGTRTLYIADYDRGQIYQVQGLNNGYV